MENKQRLPSREYTATNNYFRDSPQLIEHEQPTNSNSPNKQRQSALYTQEELNVMKEEIKKNPLNPTTPILVREIKRQVAQQSGFTDRSSLRAQKKNIDKNGENNQDKNVCIKNQDVSASSSERKIQGVQKFRSQKKQTQEDSLEHRPFKGLGYKLVLKNETPSKKESVSQKQQTGYQNHKLSEESQHNQSPGNQITPQSATLRQKGVVSLHSGIEKKTSQPSKSNSVYFQGQLNQSRNNSNGINNGKYNRIQTESCFLNEETPYQSKSFNKMQSHSCTLLDLRQQLTLQDDKGMWEIIPEGWKEKRDIALRMKKSEHSKEGDTNSLEKNNPKYIDLVSGKKIVGAGEKERRVLSSFVSDKNLNILLYNRRFDLEPKGELKRQLEYLKKQEVVNQKVREKFNWQFTNDSPDQASKRTQQLSSFILKQQEKIIQAQGININAISTQGVQSNQLATQGFNSRSSSQSHSPTRIKKDLREQIQLKNTETKKQPSNYLSLNRDSSQTNLHSQNEISFDPYFWAYHKRFQSDAGMQGSQKVNFSMQKIFNSSRNTLNTQGVMNNIQKIYSPLTASSKDKNQNENEDFKEDNKIKLASNLSDIPMSPIKLKKEPSSQFASQVFISQKSKQFDSGQLGTFSQEILQRGGSPLQKMRSIGIGDYEQNHLEEANSEHKILSRTNFNCSPSKIQSNLAQAEEIRKIFDSEEYENKELVKEQENLFLGKYKSIMASEKIINVNIKKERRRQLGISDKLPSKILDEWSSQKIKNNPFLKFKPNKMRLIRKALQKLLKKTGRLNLNIFEVTEQRVFPQKAFEKPGSYQFLNACRTGRADQVESMLQKNPHFVHEFNELHQTGLHIAAFNNRFDASLILLKFGADPNYKDCADQTPLYYAVKNNNHLLVRYLFFHRAIPWSQPNLNYYNQKMDDEMRAIFNLARVVNFLIHLPYKFNEKIWEVFMVSFDDYQHNEDGILSNQSGEESILKMEHRY